MQEFARVKGEIIDKFEYDAKHFAGIVDEVKNIGLNLKNKFGDLSKHF